MNHKSGCLICGEELVYSEDLNNLECQVCKKSFESNVACKNKHYICDECHGDGAMDLIVKYCLNSKEIDPIKLAVELMKFPQIKMHGPEHHLLVPAVMLTVYQNTTEKIENLEKILTLAKKRAEKVPGGYCGSHGNCGAGVGSGIFMSLITRATPISDKEWQLSNMITGSCLMKIAEKGGPRCCKRDSFIAIANTCDFVNDKLQIEIPYSKDVVCEFSHLNKECLFDDCDYFK